MEDPFDSAKLLLDGAQENIRDFADIATTFIHPDNWSSFVNLDPKTGEYLAKLRFKTDMPKKLTLRAKGVFRDLRDALDHALFASARMTGRRHPTRCKFPFGDTAAEFEQEIVMKRKCDDLHPDVLKLVIASHAYEAGNRTLWAMNKVRNKDTHTILSPSAPEGTGYAITGGYTGRHTVVSIVSEWKSTRRELTVLRVRVSPDAKFNVEPFLTISLDRALGFGRRAAVEVFAETYRTVEALIADIERATRSASS